MKLTDLIATIVSTKQKDWKITTCWGASTGPSYCDHFKMNFDNRIELVGSQGIIATLKSDISISLAFGLNTNENFSEPWLEVFDDKSASRGICDVRYHGALVFRFDYVSVDGARAKLPLPFPSTKIPRDYSNAMRLLNLLENNQDYDSYFSKAGMVEENQAWE